ncbi:MAG: PAS domain-containing protein [Candidatus Tenebribacter burtonii]|jgi:PAS domain S-box-containing protein|nr:PAS domain-containing protein [Candidatus Tenebribacter burtonii]
MKNSEKSKEQLMKEIDQLRAKIDDLKKSGSERKLDKDVQTTEKEFSKILLDNANAFILTLDVNANITLFNKFAEKLTGYKKDEVLGKNWFDLFISKRNGSVIPEVFQDVLKEMPDVSSYENPILCKDSSERITNWENTVLKNENGETSGVLSIGIEITKRKKAEEALKNSEERLNILFESAPDAYYLNDFTGKFIDGNKAAEKLLGYPREELIGKNFVEVGILYPIQAKKALDVLARNINGESIGPDE